MTYPNASNFRRYAYTREANAGLPTPKAGTRRERRAALAKVRQALTNPGVLDAYNATLPLETLHPTRGYRTINPKRIAAGTITQMTKDGFGMGTQDMKEALKEAE